MKNPSWNAWFRPRLSNSVTKHQLNKVGDCFEELVDNSTPAVVHDWFRGIQEHAKWTKADFQPFLRLSYSVGVWFALFIVSGIIVWFASLSWITTAFLAVGISLGTFGIIRQIAEIAAIGGIFGKALAWYLAPSMESLTAGEQYGISVALAAFLEYPFLSYANSLSLRLKTALRLRAIQDATDVCASFVLIGVSGTAVVDGYAIGQAGLALLRVAIAFIGEKYFEKDTVKKATIKHAEGVRRKVMIAKMGKMIEQLKQKQVAVPPEVDLWIEGLDRVEIDEPHHPDSTKASLEKKGIWYDKHAIVCAIFTIIGVTLGTVGMVTLSDPYVLGIAGVFGMGLAWYVGPSLDQHHFMLRWLISVILSAALEYPFLTAANRRAAETGETFQLRAVQDLVSLVTGATLIVILSDARLTKTDIAQLIVGFLRVVVASRFFWTM